MINRIVVLTMLFFAYSPLALADKYEFDKSHTVILFFVNHLGFSDMVGIMTDYNGQFQFDPKEPEKSVIQMTLNPSGIRTSSSLLDQVLQGSNFFNASQFPAITFSSTRLRLTGENSADLTGDLTMLGVTKPVTFHVHFNKAGYSPVTQEFVAGFHADGSLKRSDFGMNYLIPMVDDEVRLHIETEGIDIDRKKAMEIKKR